MSLAWMNTRDFAEAEDDIRDWQCSGCRYRFLATDSSPRLEIHDGNRTLLFCALCVEHGKFPQPSQPLPLNVLNAGDVLAGDDIEALPIMIVATIGLCAFVVGLVWACSMIPRVQ